MRPKLLIWDWNGTILDDRKLCFAIENELLRERGMREITEEWYLDHFSFPVQDYYRRMGYTFETESYEAVSAIFMERYRARYRTCALRAGVLDVLNAAQAQGFRQTLLSVTRQDDLILQAETFGAAQCFSEILGQADELARSKTERAEAYLAACGIAPDDALFIGDTNHDAETAAAVGCRCVLLTGGHQSAAVLRRCGVPVFDSVRALWERIGQP